MGEVDAVERRRNALVPQKVEHGLAEAGEVNVDRGAMFGAAVCSSGDPGEPPRHLGVRAGGQPFEVADQVVVLGAVWRGSPVVALDHGGGGGLVLLSYIYADRDHARLLPREHYK